VATSGLSPDPAEYRKRLDDQPDEQIDAWASELMRDIAIRRGVLKVIADFRKATSLDERQFERVFATDISLDAIQVAAGNAATLGKLLKSAIEFRHGSLLAPLKGEMLHAIVCNPPYVSFGELSDLPADVRDWEPSLALLSPQDGLSVTRDLVRQTPQHLASGGLLAIEVDTRRAGTVAEMVAVDGRYTRVEVLLDLTGRERFVFARRV